MTSNVPDSRQDLHVQKYKSDFYTLALTGPTTYEPAERKVIRAHARIRVFKDDLRLPMTCMIGFDVDGGNPLAARILTGDAVVGQDPSFKAEINELVLCRRTYSPLVKLAGSAIGNSTANGMVDVPNRIGNLGFAFQASSECDAVEIYAELPHAVGELKVGGGYNYGRWVFGYSFACIDRLSREEWLNSVMKTNVMIEVQGAIDNHSSDKVLPFAPVVIRGEYPG